MPVHGIDLSPAMVAEMQARPGAERVGVTIGDMATTRVGGPFRLVYLVANSIANLTTQDAQVACFENAAAHLELGGHFVIELYVPALRRLPPGQTVVPFAITPTHLGIRGIRRGHSDRLLPPLLDARREVRQLLGAVPIHLAFGAGPHGSNRRHVLGRALGRLEPGALHERQQEPCVGLGESCRDEIPSGQQTREPGFSRPIRSPSRRPVDPGP